MLKQKAITMIVAGSLAIVAVSGTAFAAKSAIDKKEEMRASISESLSSEEASIIEELKGATSTTIEEPATVSEETTTAKETSPPVTRKIPKATKAGETAPQKSAEELEAEYQEEYNYIMLKSKERVARYQRSIDHLVEPQVPPENATQEEIDEYNQIKKSTDDARRRHQRAIDGEIQMRDNEIRLLNERYGK